MAIIFSELVKHGRLTLAPNVSTSFEDEGAEEYFVKAGWAKKTKDEVVVAYPEGSVEIDPETRHNYTGNLVLEPHSVTTTSGN